MNNNLNNKKVIIYCRVSTKEQVDEGNSLATQEKVCKEYAQKYSLDVVETFVEQGESAKTADRTELRKLLAYCADKKNQISAVVIYKIDRLSRNTYDYGSLKMILKKCGVEIKSVSENLENSPTGNLMETMLSGFAQFDNDVRAERCAGGMKDAMREGRYVWMAPIGFDNVRVGGKSNIAPNKMAPLVKKSFELVSTGLYTTDDVWRMMCKEGLRQKKGNPIVKSYFHSLLRNKLYMGYIDKFKECHKGLFEPIITEELFNQVQRILKNNGKKMSQYKTDNPDFPLRRFVTHPVNSLRLTGSWSRGRRGKKYAFYRFGMKGSNYQKTDFEKNFMAYMDEYSLNVSDVKKLKGFIAKEFTKATETERKETHKLRARLTELQGQQTILVQKNLKGILNDVILKQQLDLIDKEMFDIQTTLVNIKDTDLNATELLEFCEAYLLKPSSAWKGSGISTQIKLQRFQFPSGMYFDGNIFGTPEISFVFKTKDAFSASSSSLVDPRGFEPPTPSVQMRCSTK